MNARACGGRAAAAPPTLDWHDGQPYSRRYGDVYFSRASGAEEKRHVFLEGNHLPRRFASLAQGQAFAIGETGFGTGLGFLCAWELFAGTAPPRCTLDFLSIERHPLDERELAAALALWPALARYARELVARWPRRVPGWNRWHLGDGRVRLTLVLDDAAAVLPELAPGMDAWFLDGFSPARNPEMWTQAVLDGAARASRPGATCATYTAAGHVRRGLEQAGFRMERRPGFACKRDMLCGALAGNARAPMSTPPARAIVIGAGIAGCAAAAALARRGVPTTLVEHAPRPAAAASGNPYGILHARLSAGMNLLQRFILAAYGYTLALLDEILPADGIARAQCGTLQLACSPEEARRIGRLAAQCWPAHVFRPVDAAEASALAGVGLAHGGLWFPSAGWVVPERCCAALARHPSITLRARRRVEALSATAAGWRLSGHDADGHAWTDEAGIVVACTGHEIAALPPLAHLPLTPVRGQITRVPAVPRSSGLRTVLCARGYLTPAQAGMHVLGATHGFGDTGTDVRAADHRENLARLREISPALAAAMRVEMLDVAALAGRAAVRASAPGATPLAGALSPGLYTSLGHGTRGLVTAGLAGELIAALACEQLPPLPASVVRLLSPAARAAG